MAEILPIVNTVDRPVFKILEEMESSGDAGMELSHELLQDIRDAFKPLYDKLEVIASTIAQDLELTKKDAKDQKLDEFKEIEERREEQREEDVAQTPKVKPKGDRAKEFMDMFDFALFAPLKGLSSVGWLFWGGIAAAYMKFNDLDEMWRALDFDNAVERLIKSVKSFGQGFTKFTKQMLGPVDELVGPFTKKFSEWFKSFGGFFRGISEAVDSTGKGFGKTMQVVGEILKSISRIGSTFIKFLGPVGIAISTALSIFDFISGFVDEFKKTEGSFDKRVLAGIIGGFKEMFYGIFVAPIEFFVKTLGHAFEWMGFEETAEMLKNFSFKKLFDDIMVTIDEWADSFKTAIDALIHYPIDLINDMIDKFKNFELPSIGGAISSIFGMDDEGPKSVGEIKVIDKQMINTQKLTSTAIERERQAVAPVVINNAPTTNNVVNAGGGQKTPRPERFTISESATSGKPVVP